MSQPQSETTFQCRFSIDYLKTVNGILKIVEIVLSIIAFACATNVSGYWWTHQGQVYYGTGYGWVSFVAITGFIQAIISLIMHLLFVLNWKWNTIIELIVYGVWTIFFLIAGIVAAACAYGFATAGAAAAFTFFSMAAWAIDTAFQAQHVRISWTSSTTTTTTTTAANTTERFEGNPQY
jgi:hypothetical protein